MSHLISSVCSSTPGYVFDIGVLGCVPCPSGKISRDGLQCISEIREYISLIIFVLYNFNLMLLLQRNSLLHPSALPVNLSVTLAVGRACLGLTMTLWVHLPVRVVRMELSPRRGRVFVHIVPQECMSVTILVIVLLALQTTTRLIPPVDANNARKEWFQLKALRIAQMMYVLWVPSILIMGVSRVPRAHSVPLIQGNKLTYVCPAILGHILQ